MKPPRCSDQPYRISDVAKQAGVSVEAECEQALAQDADPRCPTIDALEGLAS